MITQRNFKIKTEGVKFYSSYLDIMNGILKLTNREKDVLSWFMDRESYSNENIVKESIFSKSNRRLAEAQLGVTPHYLNNYIKSLKKKGMIVKTNGGLELKQSIYVDKNNGIKIQFEIEPMDK